MKKFLVIIIAVAMLALSSGCDNEIGQTLFDSGHRSNDYWAARQMVNDHSYADRQIEKTWDAAGKPPPAGGWYHPFYHPYWDHY